MARTIPKFDGPLHVQLALVEDEMKKLGIIGAPGYIKIIDADIARHLRLIVVGLANVLKPTARRYAARRAGVDPEDEAAADRRLLLDGEPVFHKLDAATRSFQQMMSEGKARETARGHIMLELGISVKSLEDMRRLYVRGFRAEARSLGDDEGGEK